MLLPWSSGSVLKTRAAQPAETTPICIKSAGTWVLSEEGTRVVNELFDRIDLDMRGTIGRKEYDLYMVFTEEETCDDDTWKYLTEAFETEGGELTRRGFLNLFTSVLSGAKYDEETGTVKSDAEVYTDSGFDGVGYVERSENPLFVWPESRRGQRGEWGEGGIMSG